MKFVSALLVAAIAFVGINAKCVEEANEEFFLLPVTSKAKAEERCIENGGVLADITSVNYNSAASAVAACTEAETTNVDVWVKSWNSDTYNNVGILMNVNKESKGFTIHQYFEYTKRDVFEVAEEDQAAANPTPTGIEEDAAETPLLEEPPHQSEAEEPIDELFVDDGVGTKYEVLCQVA